MRHYLLMYDLVENYAQLRVPLRSAHLRLAQEAVDRGDLVLGGALVEPSDAAILLFKGETSAAAEAFAEADPYVLNGLVIRWRVREWYTVIGADAAHVVAP
jgi:uncharacterized protein